MSTDAAALRQQIERLDPDNHMTHYLVEMWNEVLSTDAAGSRSGATFALPYVPPAIVTEALAAEGARMLDIGCLGGYGMYDLRRACLHEGVPVPTMVGLELEPYSLEVSYRLAPTWDAEKKAHFARAVCEALPFPDACFDLVVCRLVLPYTSVKRALDELARVLRPGGTVLVQTHSIAFYLGRITWRASPKYIAYWLRAVATGLVFAATGLQPRHRWFREVALREGHVEAMCRERGLDRIWGDARYPERPLRAFRKRG